MKQERIIEYLASDQIEKKDLLRDIENSEISHYNRNYIKKIKNDLKLNFLLREQIDEIKEKIYG